MSERLVLKPTPWFLFRAVAMLLMFGIFAAMFFKDGHHGYREQNRVYYLSKTFKAAREEFASGRYSSTPQEWADYTKRQKVPFPDDPKLLPEGTQIPMPWPEELQDYNKMKESMSAEEKKLFEDYRAAKGIDTDVPEHAFDEQKIFEQWVVFGICLALALVTLVVLLRTLPRKIAVDGEAVYPVDGGRVPFNDLIRMDLRKWDNKGLAFLFAKKPDGSERKIRIDGFVYGGFKKVQSGEEGEEQDEPAEALLKRIRDNFKGEILELVAEDETSPPES